MKLSELSVDDAITSGLKAILDHGFKPDSDNDSWRAFIEDWHGEEYDDDYDLDSYAGAWEALFYVETDQWYSLVDDLMVCLKQEPTRGNSGDHDEYYAVIAVTDNTDTRYFQRLGWYSSYDGGNISEGENHEVYPQQVTITDWFIK